MVLRVSLLALSLMSLSGCVTAAVGAAGAASVTAVQDKTFGESVDDANASNQIKTRLLTAGPRRFTEVDVEVSGGVALLTGRVSTPEDRVEAENIAWQVSIVDDVANELQIREEGGVRQNVNDEWLTARVRSKLFTDGAVKSVNINIETYDGVVYLMGIARSTEELRRAAELASVVSGVREVVSYVKIREPAPVRKQNSQYRNEQYQPQ